MSRFKKFSINNYDYNSSYKLDLKMILLALGCYFINPAVSLVVFAISLSKNNKFIAYHAFHSMAIMLLSRATYYIITFLRISLLSYMVHNVLNIALFIFTMYGSYKLINNKTYTIPFISTLFNKYIK